MHIRLQIYQGSLWLKDAKTRYWGKSGNIYLLISGQATKCCLKSINGEITKALSRLCWLISGGLSIDEGGGFKIFATWAQACVHQMMALHMQSHLNCPPAAAQLKL